MTQDTAAEQVRRSQKPDCYACIHRRTIPGDAHSACAHPLTIRGHGSDLGVVAHEQGVKNGWFWWPANFDPVWLLSCNGFEAAS